MKTILFLLLTIPFLMYGQVGTIPANPFVTPAADGVTGAAALTETNTVPLITASGVLGLSKLKCPLGVCTLYDNTAVTGATSFIIRAGAADAPGTARLLSFRNNANGEVAYMAAGGYFSTVEIQSANFNLGPDFTGLRLPAASLYQWSSTSDPSAAADTGVARNAAGKVEVNNGSAGSFRDLKLRETIYTTSTEGACDATNRGRVVMVQGGAGVSDTFRICRKDAGDAYAWAALY